MEYSDLNNYLQSLKVNTDGDKAKDKNNNQIDEKASKIFMRQLSSA